MGYFSCAELAPDGTVLALGGRDGKVLLWADDGELLETLEFGESIVALCFKTTGYVITVATPTSIKNWDLSNKCIKSSKSTEICTPETLGKKKKDLVLAFAGLKMIKDYMPVIQ